MKWRRRKRSRCRPETEDKRHQLKSGETLQKQTHFNREVGSGDEGEVATGDVGDRVERRNGRRNGQGRRSEVGGLSEREDGVTVECQIPSASRLLAEWQRQAERDEPVRTRARRRSGSSIFGDGRSRVDEEHAVV